MVDPRPRLLDLFCGAGGCTRGYQDAGFEVWGVDLTASPRYIGDHFLQADVLELEPWFLNGFDAIHASPPCQAYTKLGGDHHPRLIAPVRDMLDATGLPYVIENVPDAAAELHEPVLLCGSMFDPVFQDRHRLFETNWVLRPPDWPCRHKLAEPAFPVYEHGKTTLRRWPAVYGHGGGKSLHAGPQSMGIDWMNRRELVEAIPPRFTEFIGNQLIALIEGGSNG